jgi:hypothetical protein
LPFVIDTFEEAQRLGEAAVSGLAILVKDLVQACPDIRPVISGRVPPDPKLFRFAALPLGALSVPEGVEFLAAYLKYLGPDKPQVDRSRLDSVVRDISRTPLSLVLAAKVIAQEGAGAFVERDLLRALWRRLRALIVDLSDEAELYDRVLGHIADPEVRALAKPGLLVRRLTPDIVLKMLAEPCGLNVVDHAMARDLLERLAREVALVEREEGPEIILRHRPDVRRVILPAVQRQEAARTVRQINLLAAEYYLDASQPARLAERLYHLLRLGEVVQAEAEWIESEWTNAAVERLRNAVEEVDPDARRALKLRLGMGLTLQERRSAHQEQWERAAAFAASAALDNGSFQSALAILHERSERLPGSSLPRLEVAALSGLHRWKEVIDLALPSANTASARGDMSMASELYLGAAFACQALENPSEARLLLDHAEEHATASGDPEHLVRVLAARHRLIQLTAEPAATDEGDLAQRDAARALEVLSTEGVLERLGGAALREAAAEFGLFDLSILRSALYRSGLSQVSDDLLEELAEHLSSISGNSDEYATILTTLATVQDPPQDPHSAKAWFEWLGSAPGLSLGRAIASLLRTRSDMGPRLQTWAVNALKTGGAK